MFVEIAPHYAHQLSVCISSPVGATGTVTIPGLGITNSFSVAAGAVTNISITNSVMIPRADDDTVETNGIHITASQPVAVYALNYAYQASAAFTCYPTPLLGTNYCLLARASLDNGSSEFAIVATADNTTVTITPSTNADLVGEPFNTYPTNVTLTNIGETYINQSRGDGDDVTGTWITSDKPIAVFAGAFLSFVPDEKTGDSNPLIQEQLPVDSWDTQALALSFAGRTNGDSYRVLAAYSNTVITITGKVVTPTNEPSTGPWKVTTSNEVVVVTNQAGQFYDIIIDGPAQFQASQPIQVAQFANGATSDHGATPYEGDPCEILLPPTGHYLKTNIVYTLPYTSTNGAFDENFLNIIVARSATNSTWVNGSLVSATNFVAIVTSGYYGARLNVSNRTNSGVYNVTSSQPVGVEVYGWGNWDAYGYFGGVVK